MKIALLVSGEFRCFDLAHRYWPHLTLPNLDIYFSVWKQIQYGDPSCHSVVDYEFMQKFNPVSVIIEDKNYISFSDINAKMQFHRMVTGLNAIFSSKVEYDLVVITRSDLFFGCSQRDLIAEFQKCLNNNVIGVLGPHPSNTFVEDLFIIMPFPIAKQFAQVDFFGLLSSTYAVDAPQHPLLANIFKIYKVLAVSGTVWQNVEVIRPNCSDSEDLTIGLVRQKFYEWGKVLRAGITLNKPEEEDWKALLKSRSNYRSK